MTARNLTTNGAGFDNIIEVGGTDTMRHSLNAVKLEGVITVIGLVTGFSAPDNIMEVLKRICTLRGIHVGSREHMEDMMAAMEANRIQPVIDQRIFKLEELKEALEHLVRLTSKSLVACVDCHAETPLTQCCACRKIKNMWGRSRSGLSRPLEVASQKRTFSLDKTRRGESDL